VGSQRIYWYFVLCLPNDFPTYTFSRYGPASPRFFSVEQTFWIPYEHRYAIILDNHGVPVWWYQAPARDPRVFPNGNILWFDFSSSRWEIHRLDGTLVRTLNAVGHVADPHDLQFLSNGDHLVGSYVPQSHVDTSAYGGSSDATVVNAELQEVSPAGQLVWDWKSQDHISLAETGRWWGNAINSGYDIVHWNSIQPAGDSVIASFRHLDAVYKIRKSTGEIVWKLGGTRTPESLEVRNDPRGYTFGGQHDARLLGDGTLTVFDNRTNLGVKTPRAVRYRIDEQSGTATLVRSITDPDAASSSCCGSARRLANGDWLVAWGWPHGIGGYNTGGARTFRLTYDSTISYRAEPVPGAISAQDLREGMRAMAPAP
jgi:arylsulfotransferase ASST